MTRIFDALKKVRAALPAGVTPLTSVPPPPIASAPAGFGSTAGRALPGGPVGAFTGRAIEPRSGLPLVGAAEAGEEVERQMTALRVQLESMLGERAPRTVIFHSSQSGEGTSTVVQQFARVLVGDGEQRVLLLDMHVNRPTIEVDAARHLAFCSGASRGGAADAPREPGDPVANLHALPVPADLRSRVYPVETARELLDSVAGAYDWIVIDGPPVLEAPDAATLAAVADAAVMVVRAGRTKRPVLARAVELLRKNGARVVGSVLNRRQLEIPEFIYRRI